MFRTNRMPLTRTVVAVLAYLSLLVSLSGASRAQSVNIVFSFSQATGTKPAAMLLNQGRDGALYGTTEFGVPGATTQGLGTIFRQPISGANVLLHQFTGTDGQYPTGGVTLASDGNFYGTTSNGGLYNFGVLFKITSIGAFTVLYNFSGGSDGGIPLSSPIQASDGNLYGTTTFTNSVGVSTVYQYVPSTRILKTIYTSDFTHGSGFFTSPLQASDGTLYLAAEGGGASFCGSILGLTLAGAVLESHSFPCQPGGATPGPIIQANDGNIYGTTQQGGNNGGFNSTIFELSAAGLQVLYNFGTVTSDGSFVLAGLTQGTDDNFYGAAALGGAHNAGSLFELTSGGTYSKLYDFLQRQNPTYQYPQAAPTQHTNSFFYGVTTYGGRNALGQVYRLSQGLGSFVTFVRAQGKAGSQAQILGQGLTGTASVTFNGVPAAFRIVSDTYLTATVPAGAGSGRVVVVTPSGSLTSNKNFNVQ